MNNWKEYKLGDISDYISRGVTPLYSEDGVIVINQKCVRDGQVKYEQSRYTNSEKKKITEEKYLKSFDILINSTGQGTLGRVGQVKEITTPTTVDSHLTIVRIKNNINPVFIGYVLKSKQSLIEDLAEGTTGQTELSRHKVAGIPILLPDLPTQTSIAEILSSLDDKIELNNKINYELETLAQTLFKQWFIDFEFPNENGEPYKSSGGEMVDSELGEIPKGWVVGKFGDLVNLINGYAFKSKDFNDFSTEGILKIRNINGTIVDIVNTDFVTTEVVNKLNNKFKIESGEILIAMTGAEVGKIGVVAKTYKRLWLNQRVGKIIPKNNMHISYIHTMFNVLNFTDIVRNEAMGSAQPNISSQGIENIKCLIPETNLIDEFSSLHNDKFSLFYFSIAENQELTILRDTLLPKLISGELEINEINN